MYRNETSKMRHDTISKYLMCIASKYFSVFV